MESFDEEKLKESVENNLGLNLDWSRIDEGVNTVYEAKSIDSKENFVVKVHTNLKTGKDSYSSLEVQKSRFKAEAEIYNLLENIEGVPSPKIAYKDFSEIEVSSLFYVMEKIKGEKGEKTIKKLNNDKIESILFEYGKILGKIHRETVFDDYGLILYNENKLNTKNKENNWKVSFKSMIRSIDDIIEKKWNEKPSLDISNVLEKAEIVPENRESVLIHSDNRWENLIIKDDSIEGFLDWSFTRKGEPYYDLVRAEYLLIDYNFESRRIERSDFRKSLKEGYQEEYSLPDIEDIDELRSLYRYTTILWILGGIPNWGSDMEENNREKRKKKLLDELENEKFWV